MSIYTTRICMGTYGLSVLSILWKISVNIYICFIGCFLIFQEKKTEMEVNGL